MSGHMVNAQQLNGYINVYMRQYYPWIQIKPPIVDVDQFYDENSTNDYNYAKRP
jgi:hypothetical protein